MAPPSLLAAMAMFAADEKGEPAQHLLLGQLEIAADELADTLGELLLVGHGDDRTDRCRPAADPTVPASSASHALWDVGRPLHLRLCRLPSALVSPPFLPPSSLLPILLR